MKNKLVGVVVLILVFCFSSFSSAQDFAPIVLPAVDLSDSVSLKTALEKRESQRSFDPGKEIPPQVLSNLLWAAFGINRPESGKRTAPSARNWQEIDIYVALASGLYLYDAKENILQPKLAQDIRADIGIQEFTQDAPVGLVYVADFSRMSEDKEYNIFSSATDTGFISQNVYLYCAAENLSTVVLGWVDKANLAKIMGLAETQHVILTQPVGYPK